MTVRPDSDRLSPAGSTDPVVLVTGYPSFIAGRVLRELLELEPGGSFRLVVPSYQLERAHQALDRLADSDRARVEVLEGETPHLDMGLSGAEYRALAREITLIQHCQQMSDIGVGRELGEEVNVGGMREVLELGRVAPHLERIVVHSSALVGGDREGLVLESDLGRGQSFPTAAAETLARAERMARSAMPDLPLLVLRPTHVVGDATTGETGELDGFSVLLLAMLSSPASFTGDHEAWLDLSVDMVPVDYVVRAACHLGQAAGVAGWTYHLANPRPPSLRRVAELVRGSAERFFPGASISHETLRAVLAAPAARLVARGYKALALGFVVHARYDTHHADRALRPARIVCPPFETYVDVLVMHLMTRALGRLPRVVT